MKFLYFKGSSIRSSVRRTARKGQSRENDEPKQTMTSCLPRGGGLQASPRCPSMQGEGVGKGIGVRTRLQGFTVLTFEREMGLGGRGSYLGAGVVGRLAALTLAGTALSLRVRSRAAL